MPVPIPKEPKARRLHIYSFCESVAASGGSSWHIRLLSDEGRKLSGGADTFALCGREVSWDLAGPITERNVGLACVKCVKKYKKKLWASGGME